MVTEKKIPVGYAGDRQNNWKHRDVHPIDLIENKEWDKLVIYSEDNLDMLGARLAGGERTRLTDSVETGVFLLNITEDKLKRKKKDHAIFALGKVKGALTVISRLLSSEVQDQRAVRIAESRLSGIKNLNEIILKLEINGTLSHKDLAKQMNNMNPPTLTDNMKKIVAHGLVYSQQAGKYKYYYLTDSGVRYARQLRRRRNSDVNMSRTYRQLGIWLSDEKTREQTLHMLQRVLDENRLDVIKLQQRAVNNYGSDYEKKETVESNMIVQHQSLQRQGTPKKRAYVNNESNILSSMSNMIPGGESYHGKYA